MGSSLFFLFSGKQKDEDQKISSISLHYYSFVQIMNTFEEKYFWV